MHLTLISATPSPYARKIRIALLEKNIPFTLQTEVPWDSTTKTTLWNPLEKLPVLIIDESDSSPATTTNGAFFDNERRRASGDGYATPDGGDKQTAVYESHFILEYLEAKFPGSKCPLLDTEGNVDNVLAAKQWEVLADGVCDALVLLFFEKQRAEGCVSEAWSARQHRKVEGGLAAMDKGMKDGGRGFLVGGKFGLADVAVGCLLGYMACRWPQHGWAGEYPRLKRYADMLEGRESFGKTRPSAQVINDRIV